MGSHQSRGHCYVSSRRGIWCILRYNYARRELYTERSTAGEAGWLERPGYCGVWLDRRGGGENARYAVFGEILLFGDPDAESRVVLAM
jgi:hypothetical protein